MSLLESANFSFHMTSVSDPSLTASVEALLKSPPSGRVDFQRNWLRGWENFLAWNSEETSGPVFTICDNPINFILKYGQLYLFFPFCLPTAVFWFLKNRQAILKKKWLYTSVRQSHKKTFWLKLSILGKKVTTARAAFQSNSVKS